ncbi:MAG: trypsin-like serine protease [Myxococcales bacterium]|nr:trypsin-like serine protease [Myxococcales bacterium]
MLAIGCLDAAPSERDGDEDADKIAGGRLAKPNEFPSVVAFIRKNYRGPDCTGTLIAPQTVLTAAHCVDLANPKNLLVATGSVDPFREASVDYEVDRILIHPSFDLSTFEGERFDVALVYLKEPAVDVPLMELNRADAAAGLGAKIVHAGFGAVLAEDAATAGALRTITQKAKGCDTVEDYMYADAPGSEAIDEVPDDKYVCHVERRDIGIRAGDSGGPGMIRKSRTRLVQVSVHHALAPTDGTPSYTYDVRLSAHMAWIDEHIDPPAEQ